MKNSCLLLVICIAANMFTEIIQFNIEKYSETLNYFICLSWLLFELNEQNN